MKTESSAEKARVLSLSHELTHGSPASVRLIARCDWQPDSCPVAVDLVHYTPALVARFADFQVVKAIIELVLGDRPTAATFDYLCTDTVDILRLLLALDVACAVTADISALAVGGGDADQRWAQATLAVLTSNPPAGQLSRDRSNDVGGLSYEYYALSARNHNLLVRWSERIMRFFKGRDSVLDLGCGTGVFLDQLQRSGAQPIGIDSNASSVRYAQLLGVDARHGDGAEFLKASPAAFDAIHCSHMVEHLPWPQLSSLMRMIAEALRPGGIAVLVFPDPESIRSQLLGFWRDPDHERFYHPDVVATLARSCGLVTVFNSQQEVGREVVPFSMSPPEDEFSEPEASAAAESEEPLAATVARLSRRLDRHEAWIRQLWAVNQTWAWADDAVLVVEKAGG